MFLLQVSDLTAFEYLTSKTQTPLYLAMAAMVWYLYAKSNKDDARMQAMQALRDADNQAHEENIKAAADKLEQYMQAVQDKVVTAIQNNTDALKDFQNQLKYGAKQ